MSIREVLKSNKAIRVLGKKIKIYFEFWHDAVDFSHFYLESAESRNNYDYSIMLYVHSIEKGLCMENARPFGFSKVKNLVKILKNEKDKEKFEYQAGIAVLNAWVAFFKEKGWEHAICKEVESFLSTQEKIDIKCGEKSYSYDWTKNDYREYENIVLSRCSVRDFQDRRINDEDIMSAIKCFQYTPTACNRQMCKLIRVESKDKKKILLDTLIGIPGFNKETVSFFVVTYDIAAFAYSGERNQGLFNAGLATMNFVNALHARGIGSCCLQWSNKRSEDRYVRDALGLSDSERIAIVIGAGYYLQENIIPCSVRRPIKNIFTTI